MIYVSRGPLWALLELSRFPAVQLGQILVGPGPEAWEKALPLFVPAQRAHIAGVLGRGPLPKAINPERWEQYATATPERSPMPCFGDDAMLPLIARGRALLPAPVLNYVDAHCMALLVGRRCDGWTGGALPVDRRPIMLNGTRSDDYVVATALHEYGHCWLKGNPPGVAMLACPPGDDDQACERERLAELLALAWLAGAGATP